MHESLYFKSAMLFHVHITLLITRKRLTMAPHGRLNVGSAVSLVPHRVGAKLVSTKTRGEIEPRDGEATWEGRFAVSLDWDLATVLDVDTGQSGAGEKYAVHFVNRVRVAGGVWRLMFSTAVWKTS